MTMPVGSNTPFAKIFPVFALAVALLFSLTLPGHAQRKISLIRDAEIEALLKDYSADIFRAAGLRPGYVEVFLVDDRNFNAFVTGRRMYFHTGALLQAKTPNEIIGVIAHETGHIIGGHQQRMRDRVEAASAVAAVGVLLGAGAMASGSDLGSAAGRAIIQGGGSTLMRSLLAYKREEESAADRTAVTLLDKTGQSARGMIETFQRLDSQLLFSGSKIDPYIQTHPMPRDRKQQIETVARNSPHFGAADSPALQLRHDMMRAKIAAHTGGLSAVNRLFRDNPKSPAASYGVAIAQYLRGKGGSSIKILDRLIRQQPNNPYLHEMKAEALLRARKPADAIGPMRKAISLDRHKSGILRIQYGHILLETRKAENVRQAIKELKAGLARDPKTISGHVYLARAYSLLGDEPRALAATAEQQFLLGQYKEAKQFAIRAQQNLNKNTPEWLRLQDIVLYKPKKKQR